jgi:DNA-binding NarL/FixJ family response regulator
MSECRHGKVAGRDLREKAADALLVLVIDSRPLIRACLLSYLRQCEQVDAVGAAEVKGCDADTIGDRVPDIVLYCIADGDRLPSNRSQVFLDDGEKYRLVPVIVLSSNRPANQIFDLLRGGIRGFIPTNVGMEVAVQAMRLVHAGGTFVPESCLHSLPEKTDAAAEPTTLFTHRQLQVVEAIRQGKPNKIIAYELSMCESTVKVHVRTIMKKLQARNRTQVAYLYASAVEGDKKEFAPGHVAQRL